MTVKICPICDIAGCNHIRAERAREANEPDAAVLARLLAAEVRHADELARILRERDGGVHDESCKSLQSWRESPICNCDHDEAMAILAAHDARRAAR